MTLTSTVCYKLLSIPCRNSCTGYRDKGVTTAHQGDTIVCQPCPSFSKLCQLVHNHHIHFSYVRMRTLLVVNAAVTSQLAASFSQDFAPQNAGAVPS